MIDTEPDDECTRSAWLIAKAQAAGYTVTRRPAGGFDVTRWGQFVRLGDIGALERWLTMVTGKRAA